MIATLIAASDDPANVFARCGCADPTSGARLGRRCPLLGQPGHGSWYFAAELPPWPANGSGYAAAATPPASWPYRPATRC